MPAKPAAAIEPRYFASAAEFRTWLAAHAASQTELLVGFHKVGSGVPSMTWPESVDAALCVGWIDGVRKRVDDARYQIRFSPRKPGSIWSAVNIAKVEQLTAAGLMQPAGLAVYAQRSEARSRVYAFERETPAELEPAEQRQFARADWLWFEAQAPSWRVRMLHWVVTAKRTDTRAKRLAELVAGCAARRRIRT
ncbi:MAG: YdeI/OmpD-associated family protein [Pelomonas sp.]|nr:YdeI/OmpD-associated family protein [Roseateles sp.]